MPSCFLAGHILPQALLYWVRPGSESLGGTALYIFPFFLKKKNR